MFGLFSDDADDLLAFVDTLFNACFIFLGLFVLTMMLPHQKEVEAQKKEGITPGRMCVMLAWPGSSTADIDLWGRSPDGTVVGYTARASKTMDLLRDDLGNDGKENGGNNFEMMCSKVLQKGEWVFNAHFFGTHNDADKDVPLTLTVNFPIGDDNTKNQKQITVHGILHDPGNETTLLDFDLDADGIVVPSSVNDIFQPVRDQK